MKWPGSFARLLWQSLFRKPATVDYPADKSGMPAGFRGKLHFDPHSCVGCQMCVRDCPAGAITITRTGDKQFQADINLGKCIYCGQCVDSCVKKALSLTSAFELAEIDPASLRITFNAGTESNAGEKT